MKFKQTLWSLCGIAMLCALTTNLYAQVTIGSTKKPVDGALLMLDDGTTGTAGENAMKGLGLPRVELTKLKPTSGTELSASIGGTGDWNIDEHTGLVVYNVKPVEDICNPADEQIGIGLHVWDGTQWQGLGTEAGGGGTPSPNYSEFVDNRDPADPQTYSAFHYKVNNTTSPTIFDDVGVWMLDNVRAKTFVPNADRDNTDNTISIDFDGTVPSYEQTATKPIWTYPNKDGETDGSKSDLYDVNPEMGLLYNWVAMSNNKNVNLEDFGDNAVIVQGICPTGWHLPTAAEWASLAIHFMYYTDSYANGSAPLASLGSLDATDMSESAKYIIGRVNLRIPTGVFTTPCAYIDESALAAGTTIEDVKGKAKPKNRGGFNVMYPGLVYRPSSSAPGNAIDFGHGGSYAPSNAMVYGGSQYEKMNFMAIKDRILSLNDGNPLGIMMSVRCKKN